jgi:hypothetical protein
MNAKSSWIFAVAALAGCAGFDAQTYQSEQPTLWLEEYFNGTLDAWGMFQKRDGTVVKRFKVVVDVIGLSFSSHFKAEDAFVMVSGLRQMVDEKVQIRVGGEAFEQAAGIPDRIQVLNDLYDVERELMAWRQKSA